MQKKINNNKKKMKFLQLDQTKGSFFEYSGIEKEGFSKFESSKGKVSYRKYYEKGINGELESVSLYDGKFGKQIQLCIRDAEDLNMFQVDLYDQKDHVSTFAEELIKFLPNLNKGMNLDFNAYNFTPEGEQYAKRGFSLKSNGEKVSRALSNAYYKKEDGTLVEGDIPAVKWVEKLGKRKPSPASLEEKDDFLLEVVSKETDKLKFVPTSQDDGASKTEEKPKEKPLKAESFEGSEDEDEDLPF